MQKTPSDEYADNITDTVRSFWHGLSITLSYLLRRPITTQYPDRTELPIRDTLPPRYRGFLEVDSAICTGCQACERACPISCIQITMEKDAANPKQRVVAQFDIDEAKCMFCGLCVEPCPTGAIQHTREFEASRTSVRNLVFRWADAENPFPVYKVPKGADYHPRAPLGSLVRVRVAQHAWDAPGPQYLPPLPPGEAAKPVKKVPAAPAPATAPPPAPAPAPAPAAAAAKAPPATSTQAPTPAAGEPKTIPTATSADVIKAAVDALSPAETAASPKEPVQPGSNHQAPVTKA